jgi:indolepyruvate ferredoxin oxidoreductase
MTKLLKNVSLNDKYDLEEGVAFMSGLQALARIPLVQMRRDRAAGLNTAGFISGYRGSPLGGYDMELTRAKKLLDSHNITFEMGVNEDLAATSVWGTQQVNLMGGSNYDGVFGIWYGKAPGVDRSGDVMRHANAYGTSPKGGVLAICGDDHACKSSTLPCQSDHALYAYMIPMLYPASIQEFVEYGVLGIEMSRYSGCWTALKVTSENVETSGTVDLSRENRMILTPDASEFEMPKGGVHIRLNDIPREVDWRLQNYKLFACHAFCRKNKIDRVVMDSPKPRFGIVTAGKSYGDVRQALVELGITDEVAKEIGLRLYKVGMPWPLEPQGAHEFVEGLEEILVVEEKRELIESQLTQQIFNWPPEKRPMVVGKYDENRKRLLPLDNDHNVGMVARIIAQRIARFYHNEQIDNALEFHERYEREAKAYIPPSLRKPYYCAGCPHNTSTKVPEDGFAMVGIGCHYMVQWMDRNSALCTQMGGEGVPWIGMSKFTERKHIFANLGDGTYFHSGSLAIRAAVAAKVNITYKVLYNDAVAMTGGQHVDGELPVYRVAQQVMSEGVNKAWILSENPQIYKGMKEIPADVKVLSRDELHNIMKECQETEGTSVIIYDQTCAAEKRRRRKRGLYPDPAKRVIINDSVCEGCGDCSVQSNCVAVQPLETEYGRKRKINQSLCNKDFSCLKGFCPSFVTVYGGALKKTKAESSESDNPFAKIPMPELPKLDKAYNIIVTGIGGTGVLTIGALLGMAAHLEDKCCRNLDMTGLAQKGGEVLSHVRIGPTQDDLRTGHIIAGGADLLVACDIVSAVGATAYKTLNPDKTNAVVNGDQAPVSAFVTNNDIDFAADNVRSTLLQRLNSDGAGFIPATEYARVLLGDEINTNILMLGYAWQKGLVPLRLESIYQAIELNGVAVETNQQAFAFGRLAAHDLTKIDAMLDAVLKEGDSEEPIAETLADIIARRTTYLSAYQNNAYASRYQNLVKKLQDKEKQIMGEGADALSLAGARYYHKLLAYKDEYEVARLYTDGQFLKKLKGQFDGDFKIEFNLAPPLLSRTDPATGRPKKIKFGAWMLHGFGILAKMKGLRGTPLDVFGYTAERKAERQLIKDYEATVAIILGKLSKENAETCLELLNLPEMVKGYGPVKHKNIEAYYKRHVELINALEYQPPLQEAA